MRTDYRRSLKWLLILFWMSTYVTANAASIDTIPKAVANSLERNQIPKDALSISVV